MIDKAIPSDAARRPAAGRAILAAEPVPVDSIDELKRSSTRFAAARTLDPARGLAAVGLRLGVEALVSGDGAFASVPKLPFVAIDSAELDKLLA